MSTCTKISYSHRSQALAALNAISRAMKRKGRQQPQGVYLCASCRAWHLTSSPRIQPAPWRKRTDRPVPIAAVRRTRRRRSQAGL